MTPNLFAKPIGVLGVTGDFESGKTRFLLSIAPGPETCVFDTEGSATTYQEIGFRHVDVPKEMLRAYPAGYKPIDTFTWFWGAVKGLPAGKFRVITLDVAEDIESGLADWVWENPLHFNHTRQQYLKMSGIYWGDVKALWKTILLDIQSRCETFAFAVHTGSVWGADNKPLRGMTRPKGKSTLMELATLFLHMERPTGEDGTKQEVPSAKVLKTRLSHNAVVNGSLQTKAILPPRLPVATVEAIRAYMAKPADFGNLSAAERAVPTRLNEDERSALRLATAQAEADVESLRLQRVIEERKSGVSQHVEPELTQTQEADQPTPTEASPAPAEAVASTQEPASATTPAAAPTPTQAPAAPKNQDSALIPLAGTVRSEKKLIPAEPKAAVTVLWEEFCYLNGIGAEQKFEMWKAQILSRYNVTMAKELTDAQIDEIVEKLKAKIKKLYEDRGVPEGCPF